MNRYLCGLLCVAVACSASRPTEGLVAGQVKQSSIDKGIPADLVLALAVVEGGLKLPRFRDVDPTDEVPVAGILELRHGAFNSLARGAELLGVSEETLRRDTDLGTEAGLRVLAELAERFKARADDVNSYQDAIEGLSGLGTASMRSRYAAEVYTVLKNGGAFAARGNEVVRIEPRPDVEIPAIREDSAGGEVPDYLGAIWIPTRCDGKCTYGRPDGIDAVDTVVIHDTEGGWYASVATLQYDLGKSVHYIVDADGSRVGQFLHEVDTAWHAGNWFYNKHSIGIEHVGFAADPLGYDTNLYWRSVDVVQNILTRWPNIRLNRNQVVGHYQVPNGTRIPQSSPPCGERLSACETSPNYGGASSHRDPGIHWQWCQYLERLGGDCTCNDAYAHWNCTTDHTEAVRCAGGIIVRDGPVEIDHCEKGCIDQPIGVDDICQHAAPRSGDKAEGLAARD